MFDGAYENRIVQGLIMSNLNCEGFGGLFRIITPANRYIYDAIGLAALGSMAIVSTLLVAIRL